MRMPVTTRRAGGQRSGYAHAAARKPAHLSTPAESVKGDASVSLAPRSKVADHFRNLHSELAALHADGDFTSARHQALCEAIAITGRALAVLEQPHVEGGLR